MCQLCTQTHTHTGSRMLSRCCSRRWRLESGVAARRLRTQQQQQQTQTCCAQLALQRMVAQSTIRKKVIVHLCCCSASFLFVAFVVLFGTWIVSGIGMRLFCCWNSLKISRILYYFCICLRHGTHTLSAPNAWRAERQVRECECEWERAREKERVWSQKHKQTAAAEAAARNYKHKNKQIYL